MKKNKYNIGDKVKTNLSTPKVTDKIAQISWDEDLNINCYVLNTFWFPFTEKELELNRS